jgi:hypothetical protein
LKGESFFVLLVLSGVEVDGAAWRLVGSPTKFNTSLHPQKVAEV